MQKSTLERFRKRLQEMQQTIEHDVASSSQALTEQVHRPGELSTSAQHSGDHDSEGLDAEIAIQRTLRGDLEDIESALMRIEAGNYGVCVRCGKAIGSARLDALPQAPLCIDCERAVEG